MVNENLRGLTSSGVCVFPFPFLLPILRHKVTCFGHYLDVPLLFLMN